MTHAQDLTVGVMFGLAWYFLLAAMMNAAAAAYVSYGEMVSEGASRVGLAPKTRRLAGLADRRLSRPVRPGHPDDPGAAPPAGRRRSGLWPVRGGQRVSWR